MATPNIFAALASDDFDNIDSAPPPVGDVTPTPSQQRLAGGATGSLPPAMQHPIAVGLLDDGDDVAASSPSGGGFQVAAAVAPSPHEVETSRNVGGGSARPSQGAAGSALGNSFLEVAARTYQVGDGPRGGTTQRGGSAGSQFAPEHVSSVVSPPSTLSTSNLRGATGSAPTSTGLFPASHSGRAANVNVFLSATSTVANDSFCTAVSTESTTPPMRAVKGQPIAGDFSLDHAGVRSQASPTDSERNEHNASIVSRPSPRAGLARRGSAAGGNLFGDPNTLLVAQLTAEVTALRERIKLQSPASADVAGGGGPFSPPAAAALAVTSRRSDEDWVKIQQDNVALQRRVTELSEALSVQQQGSGGGAAIMALSPVPLSPAPTVPMVPGTTRSGAAGSSTPSRARATSSSLMSHSQQPLLFSERRRLHGQRLAVATAVAGASADRGAPLFGAHSPTSSTQSGEPPATNTHGLWLIERLKVAESLRRSNVEKEAQEACTVIVTAWAADLRQMLLGHAASGGDDATGASSALASLHRRVAAHFAVLDAAVDETVEAWLAASQIRMTMAGLRRHSVMASATGGTVRAPTPPRLVLSSPRDGTEAMDLDGDANEITSLTAGHLGSRLSAPPADASAPQTPRLTASTPNRQRAASVSTGAPTTGTAAVRPEAHSAILLSGRNVPGTKSACPYKATSTTVRADQIVQEASVQWKGNGASKDFEDFHAFAAPKVYLIGPSKSGKSSVMHCLTNKQPSLFKRAPKVEGPTLAMHAVLHVYPVNHSPPVKQIVTRVAAVSSGNVTSPFLISAAAVDERGLELALHNTASNAPTVSHPLACRFIDVPDTTLPFLGPGSLPAEGAVYAITFDVTVPLPVARRSVVAAMKHVLSAVWSVTSPCVIRALSLAYQVNEQLSSDEGVDDFTLGGGRARLSDASNMPSFCAAGGPDDMEPLPRPLMDDPPSPDAMQQAVTAAQRLRLAATTTSPSSDVTSWVPIQFVLLGTNADRLAAHAKDDLVTSLRDWRVWFERVLQRTCAAVRHALPGGRGDSSCGTTTITAAATIARVLAVSCADWTVVGDRPGSPSTFSELSVDLLRHSLAVSPLSPLHMAAHVAALAANHITLLGPSVESFVAAQDVTMLTSLLRSALSPPFSGDFREALAPSATPGSSGPGIAPTLACGSIIDENTWALIVRRKAEHDKRGKRLGDDRGSSGSGSSSAAPSSQPTSQRLLSSVAAGAPSVMNRDARRPTTPTVMAHDALTLDMNMSVARFEPVCSPRSMPPPADGAAAADLAAEWRATAFSRLLAPLAFGIATLVTALSRWCNMSGCIVDGAVFEKMFHQHIHCNTFSGRALSAVLVGLRQRADVSACIRVDPSIDAQRAHLAAILDDEASFNAIADRLAVVLFQAVYAVLRARGWLQWVKTYPTPSALRMTATANATSNAASSRPEAPLAPPAVSPAALSTALFTVPPQQGSFSVVILGQTVREALVDFLAMPHAALARTMEGGASLAATGAASATTSATALLSRGFAFDIGSQSSCLAADKGALASLYRDQWKRLRDVLAIADATETLYSQPSHKSHAEQAMSLRLYHRGVLCLKMWQKLVAQTPLEALVSATAQHPLPSMILLSERLLAATFLGGAPLHAASLQCIDRVKISLPSGDRICSQRSSHLLLPSAALDRFSGPFANATAMAMQALVDPVTDLCITGSFLIPAAPPSFVGAVAQRLVALIEVGVAGRNGRVPLPPDPVTHLFLGRDGACLVTASGGNILLVQEDGGGLVGGGSAGGGGGGASSGSVSASGGGSGSSDANADAVFRVCIAMLTSPHAVNPGSRSDPAGGITARALYNLCRVAVHAAFLDGFGGVLDVTATLMDGVEHAPCSPPPIAAGRAVLLDESSDGTPPPVLPFDTFAEHWRETLVDRPRTVIDYALHQILRPMHERIDTNVSIAPLCHLLLLESTVAVATAKQQLAAPR